MLSTANRHVQFRALNFVRICHLVKLEIRKKVYMAIISFRSLVDLRQKLVRPQYTRWNMITYQHGWFIHFQSKLMMGKSELFGDQQMAKIIWKRKYNRFTLQMVCAHF